MATTQEMLIDAMRTSFAGQSDAAIARLAGLSPQRWNNYTQGRSRMDDDAIIGCAKALGRDTKRAVLEHRADHARTTRERAFWQRLASAAVIVLALALPSLSAPVHAAGSDASRYIIRTCGSGVRLDSADTCAWILSPYAASVA